MSRSFFLREKKLSEVYKHFRCDGVKNNSEEIFSAADFTSFHYRDELLPPFHPIDSRRRNEISLVDFQHEKKSTCPTNFYDRYFLTKGGWSI